jgi:surface polysaccharide O-acyltransferase-like enzyme
LRSYFPLDNGPQEIRSLDGLRAVAALLVILYHAFVFSVSNIKLSLGPVNLYPAWNYGRTGVQLFFVLSGFLLFLPYARAILLGWQLPAARKFYQRRILRIVPAYWVCLAILVLISLPTYLSKVGLKNIATHMFFIHNVFPSFDSSIQGPFWTMAVEAQFYLLLPAIAWLIARFVGATHSLVRLTIGMCGLIAVAVGVREISSLVSERCPNCTVSHCNSRQVGCSPPTERKVATLRHSVLACCALSCTSHMLKVDSNSLDALLGLQLCYCPLRQLLRRAISLN